MPEKSDAAFRMIFGRKPTREADNIDFTHHLLSQSEVISRELDEMISSGAPPDEIYATRQLLLGNDTKSFDEHKVAFHEAQSRGETFMWMHDHSNVAREFRESGATLYGNLVHAVVHLSVFVERIGPRIKSDADFLRVYGVIRVIHLLRALRVLINKDNCLEFWGLARTIFEIYCVGQAINARPETASDLLTILGRKAKGETVKWPSPVSLLRKANVQHEVELFVALYPELSAPAHFGLDHITRYMVDGGIGISTQVQDDDPLVIPIVNIMVLLMFEMIATWNIAKGMTRRDVLYQLKYTRRALVRFLDVFEPLGSFLPSILEERIRAQSP